MNTTSIGSFKLIGLKLQHKTTNQNGQSGKDCGSHWQQFEAGNYTARIPGKLNEEVVAVYYDYEGDHTQPYAYFIGCKVAPGTPVPQGMDSIEIPAGSYTNLVAKGIMPDCVADAWRHIWDTYTNRAYGYDFEIYDERSRDWNNATVDIFISVP